MLCSGDNLSVLVEAATGAAADCFAGHAVKFLCSGRQQYLLPTPSLGIPAHAHALQPTDDNSTCQAGWLMRAGTCRYTAWTFEAVEDRHLSKRLSRKGMAGGLPWRRAISAFMR